MKLFVVRTFDVVSGAHSVTPVQLKEAQGSPITKPRALLLDIVLNSLGKPSPLDSADRSWEPSH